MSTTQDPLQAFASYPFTTDTAFQVGSTSISPSTVLTAQSSKVWKASLLPMPLPTPETTSSVALAYFTLIGTITGYSVTTEQVRQVEESLAPSDGHVGSTTVDHQTSTSSSQTQGQLKEEPRILSFSQLQELIASGRVDEIPNNKVIPDKLNDAQPSASIAPARKKPWEVALPV
ncbi:hypothetical protein AX17_001664 [Amanita inopinata Kibby_2008]|nr:hypothetical protein AX17_001664 [Amanita inopinata Kibby_2008]